MDTLKAIETVYNGYRFRSRLEARWAVFFDAMDIRYEYEKEGYQLSSGWYLPDFWLPDLQVWAEIKPTSLYSGSEFFEHPEVWDADDKTWALCNDLAKQTGYKVLKIAGNPWPDEYTIHDFYPDYDENEWGIIEGEWAECRRCDGIWITEHGCQGYSLRCVCPSDNWREPLYGATAPRLMKAYTAARQARFEHRQKG